MHYTIVLLIWISQIICQDESSDIILAHNEFYEDPPTYEIQQDEILNSEQVETLIELQIENPILEQTIQISETVTQNEELFLQIHPQHHEQSQNNNSFLIMPQPKRQEIFRQENPLEFLAQLEFIFGALMVFASFPALWYLESRLCRVEKIKEDAERLIKNGLLFFISSYTKTNCEKIIDPFNGISVRHKLRLYRCVEELLFNGKWVEREGIAGYYQNKRPELDKLASLHSETFNASGIMMDEAEMSNKQVDMIENWEPLKLSDTEQETVEEFQNAEVHGNYLYLNKRIRISYYCIPFQEITILCRRQGNVLLPLELHIISKDDSLNESLYYKINQCKEDHCRVIEKWYKWSEWTGNTEIIEIVRIGKESLWGLLQDFVPSSKLQIVRIRVTIFIMMTLGVWIFFLPIYQVLQLFPIFGSLAGELRGLIGFPLGILFASIFSSVIIGIQFCFYKRDVGIVLLSFSLIICFLLLLCTQYDFQLAPILYQQIEKQVSLVHEK